jgi:DnaK suppressor protein
MPYGKIAMPRAAKSKTAKPKAAKSKAAKTTAAKNKAAKPKAAAKPKVAKAKATKPAAAKAKTAKTKAAKPTVAKPAAAKSNAPKAKATKSRATKASTAKPKATRRRVHNGASGMEFSNFEPYKKTRGEKYMNEEQSEHFRGILLNWKSELMQEVDRTVTHMKDEAANFPDPADRATQEEEFSLELRTRDRERKLIKKIDSTMDLIDQSDYGYCDACGIEIGIQRLEARPTATQCIDCKTLAEIKEKQEMG